MFCLTYMLGLALKPAAMTPGMLYVLGLLRHTYMFTSTCLVFPHVLSNLHVGVGPEAWCFPMLYLTYMLGLALKPASMTPGMLYVLGLLRHTYMFTSTCLVFPHVLSNLHVGVGPEAGLDHARDALYGDLSDPVSQTRQARVNLLNLLTLHVHQLLDHL